MIIYNYLYLIPDK